MGSFRVRIQIFSYSNALLNDYSFGNVFSHEVILKEKCLKLIYSIGGKFGEFLHVN